MAVSYRTIGPYQHQKTDIGIKCVEPMSFTPHIDSCTVSQPRYRAILSPRRSPSLPLIFTHPPPPPSLTPGHYYSVLHPIIMCRLKMLCKCNHAVGDLLRLPFFFKLSRTPLRSIQVISFINYLFLFIAEEYHLVYITEVCLIIYPPWVLSVTSSLGPLKIKLL